MQEFFGPRALVAALSRFECDDDVADAAALVCDRSLDIIEKVATSHEGNSREALLRNCIHLFISSGLPMQLFQCFCIRSRHPFQLDIFMNATPRCLLRLKLLATTCRCIHIAAVHGVSVPLSLTAGIARHFARVRNQDKQAKVLSLSDLMSLLLSKQQYGPTVSASLLMMSLLLSHCVTSELQPPDTSEIICVANHVMRYDPLSLISILAPQNSSPYLPSPFASYSYASLLLILASSCAVSTVPESPTSAAAQSFTLILIRIALISFARSRPLSAATEVLYQRIFNLVATSIESFLPNLIVDDQPLLQRLAADDSETCGELIQLYKQHVVNDEATISACTIILKASLEAARDAAVADDAIEMMRQCSG
jgi:hypothetical protein